MAFCGAASGWGSGGVVVSSASAEACESPAVLRFPDAVALNWQPVSSEITVSASGVRPSIMLLFSSNPISYDASVGALLGFGCTQLTASVRKVCLCDENPLLHLPPQTHTPRPGFNPARAGHLGRA